VFFCFSDSTTNFTVLSSKMSTPSKIGTTIRAAAVQAEPEWLDLTRSVTKACTLIEEASRNGAKIIGFPELWIPGYPAWIWSRPVDFPLTVEYIKNSLSIESEEMKALCECARENDIVIVLGFSERDGASLYISQCTIGTDGKLLMHRRKLKPSHMERTMFGDVSGGSLLNVAETTTGKVGCLSCWVGSPDSSRIDLVGS
jgi:nitrilase